MSRSLPNKPKGLLTVFLIFISVCSFAQKTSTGCPGFATYNQGDYGATNSNNIAVQYLYNNFASAFPGVIDIWTNTASPGAVIVGGNNTTGTGTNYSLTLTTPKAVQDLLSCSGPAAALTQNLTDCKKNMVTSFAGQVVTLALNVAFDDHDANFSTSSTLLGDLVINGAGGVFAGRTVRGFLDEANQVLAGKPLPAGTTYKMWSDMASTINNNYVNGRNNGNLDCPSTASLKSFRADAIADAVNVSPNPCKGIFKLTLDNRSNSSKEITVMDALGRTVYHSAVETNTGKQVITISLKEAKSGIYLVRVSNTEGAQTTRLVID